MLNAIFSTVFGGYQEFKISKVSTHIGLQGVVETLVYEDRALGSQELANYIIAFALSVALLFLMTLEFLIFVLMNHDFHFFKENKYTAFNLRIHFMDYVWAVVIVFFKHLPSVLGDEPFTGTRNALGELHKISSSTLPVKIVQNLFCLAYSTSSIFNLRLS